MLRISHGFPKERTIRDVFAAEMVKEYAGRKPDKVWEGENRFLGKISKKTYYS